MDRWDVFSSRGRGIERRGGGWDGLCVELTGDDERSLVLLRLQLTVGVRGKTTTAPRLFSQLVFSSCSLQPVGSRTHTHMHPSASCCARWMVCRTIDQLSRHQRTDCQPTVRLYVRACNSSLYTNTNFSLSLTHSLSSHRAYGLPQFLGTLTRPFH